MWLADAAKVTGAKVTTLEIDEKRTQQARLHAQELQVDDVIDFWIGDAQKYLEVCQEQYDFILLDAERNAYFKLLGISTEDACRAWRSFDC